MTGKQDVERAAWSYNESGRAKRKRSAGTQPCQGIARKGGILPNGRASPFQAEPTQGNTRSAIAGWLQLRAAKITASWWSSPFRWSRYPPRV